MTIIYQFFVLYSRQQMNKVKYHIETSRNIMRCKNCKCLKMPRYLGDIFCEKCEKEYMHICSKVLHTT